VTRRTLDPARTICDAVPLKRHDDGEGFTGGPGISLAGQRKRIVGRSAR
jgi:hypothetical protein